MPTRFELCFLHLVRLVAQTRNLQGGKGEGEHDEDDAVIASIQFGGPKVRRLADTEDSSDGGGSATGADDSAADNALPRGNGVKDSSKGSKGKGKKRIASTSSEAGKTHKFQSVRKPGAPPSGTGDVGEDPAGAEDDDAGGNATASDAPGSLLVSAIEAQAKREAERAKAAAESTGAKIVVKQKKRRDKGSGESAADGGEHKQRKKHKRKDKSGDGSKKHGSVGAAAPAAAAGAAGAGLGGLNLLGSYASSSGSEGDAP